MIDLLLLPATAGPAAGPPSDTRDAATGADPFPSALAAAVAATAPAGAPAPVAPGDAEVVTPTPETQAAGDGPAADLGDADDVHESAGWGSPPAGPPAWAAVPHAHLLAGTIGGSPANRPLALAPESPAAVADTASGVTAHPGAGTPAWAVGIDAPLAPPPWARALALGHGRQDTARPVVGSAPAAAVPTAAPVPTTEGTVPPVQPLIGALSELVAPAASGVAPATSEPAVVAASNGAGSPAPAGAEVGTTAPVVDADLPTTAAAPAPAAPAETGSSAFAAVTAADTATAASPSTDTAPTSAAAQAPAPAVAPSTADVPVSDAAPSSPQTLPAPVDSAAPAVPATTVPVPPTALGGTQTGDESGKNGTAVPSAGTSTIGVGNGESEHSDAPAAAAAPKGQADSPVAAEHAPDAADAELTRAAAAQRDGASAAEENRHESPSSPGGSAGPGVAEPSAAPTTTPLPTTGTAEPARPEVSSAAATTAAASAPRPVAAQRPSAPAQGGTAAVAGASDGAVAAPSSGTLWRAATRPEGDDPALLEPDAAPGAGASAFAPAPLEAQPATDRPAASGQPSTVGGALAERVADIADRLENAPPPQRLTVELDDLGGLRVTISLRGDLVRVEVNGGTAPPQWQRDLATVLGQRGWSLDGENSAQGAAGDADRGAAGGGRGQSRDGAREDAPRQPFRPFRPSTRPAGSAGWQL